jgi:hypothetical protein
MQLLSIRLLILQHVFQISQCNEKARIVYNSNISQSLGKQGTNVYYAGGTADTVTNTDTWTYSLDLSAKQDLQLYNIHMKLDSVSGTPAHTVILSGTFDGTTDVDIDTVSWAGSSADTTFLFTDVSTGVLYKKLYITVTGASSSKSSVNFIWGKLVNKTHE